jgi:hypothetical protein
LLVRQDPMVRSHQRRLARCPVAPPPATRTLTSADRAALQRTASADALGPLLARAVQARAVTASSGAAGAAVIQRSLDDARSAVFEKYYATSSGEPVGLQKREIFDATFATWELLEATFRSRYQPREWSAIRALRDRSAAPPAPPPVPGKPAPPPYPRPAPGSRRAPSAQEWAQVQKRGQIGHVLRDVGPLMKEFLDEIELQKRYNPSEILANQMTLVMGGVAKILLGAVQVGTAGLSAPITGAMIGLVDLGTSGARAGLGQDDDAGGARAVSGTKTLMVATATRVIGPVAPFSLGPGYAAASAIPVVGGVGAIVLGFKDVADGLEGMRLSKEDVIFMRHSLVEIRDLKGRVAKKAQEMAAIPELRGMAAKWMECAKALAVVEKDLSALLAKQKKDSSPVVENLDAWSAPETRQRSGGAPPPPPPARAAAPA